MESGENSDLFEELLADLKVGVWQLPVLLTGCLVWGILAPHTIGSSLINAPVAFYCSETESVQKNVSLGYFSVPLFDNRCLLPNLTNANNLPADELEIPGQFSSCPNVLYDSSVYESTIATEWHLICEWSPFRTMFQNVYTIGAFTGCIIGGITGDKFGRQKTLLLAAAAHVCSCAVIFITNNFVLLLVARAVVGFTCLASLVSVMTLASEMFPMDKRSIVGLGLGWPHSVGMVVFAGVGYLIRTWRTLYMVTAIPAVFVFPSALWVSESPRWLSQNGKDQTAKEILKKAALKNKREITDGQLDKVIANVKSGYGHSPKPSNTKEVSFIKESMEAIAMFLSTSEMRKITFIIPTVACLHNVLYYGVIFNANNFTSTNPFAYVALTGVADGLAVLSAIVFGEVFGRKVIVGGGLATSGTLFLILLLMPEKVKWLQWILVMFAFLMVGAASQMLYVYVPELFPTVLRARGFAFTTFLSFFGAFLSPLVPDFLALEAWWAPGLCFAVCGIVSGILVPLLPETKGRPLCETVDDVEKRRKKSYDENDSCRSTFNKIFQGQNGVITPFGMFQIFAKLNTLADNL